MAAKSIGAITVSAPKRDKLKIIVRGTSEYIQNKFSEKSKQMMLDKQKGEKKIAKKEPKNPEQQYLDAMYHMPDGTGHAIPAISFKLSMVSVCREISGFPMTLAKQAFFVFGCEDNEFARITGEPYMREDQVRLESGVADIRFRPAFKEWTAELKVVYNTEILSQEDIVNLLARAGMSVGVGENRPQKSGNSFGLWEVESVEKI